MAGKKNQQKVNKDITSKQVGKYANPGNRQTLTKDWSPVVVSSASGVRVKNTELFKVVSVPGSGTVGTSGVLAFNPASSSVLPWLSGIGKSYSKYRLHSCTISYAPVVPTTQAGFVEMGVFYDYEDAIYWGTVANDNLSQCGTYAFGPMYAGGAVTSTTSSMAGDNWFGVKVDCTRVHQTYNWLMCDQAISSDADGNLSKAFEVAYNAVFPASPAGGQAFGRIFVSYDVEFIQPTAPANQKPTFITEAGIKSEDDIQRDKPGTPPTTPPPDELADLISRSEVMSLLAASRGGHQ